MNKTLTALAAALMMLAAHSSFAANKPAKAPMATASTCHSLEMQYDSAAKMHANAKKFKEAEAAHADGKKLCDEGQFSAGASKLHVALRDLGVKATSKAH